MIILFPYEVFKKLRMYTLSVETEISFLAKAEKRNEEILVSDIALLTQQVTCANTTLDKNALGKFYEEKMEKGEDPSSWKVWIHSHAHMGVCFSQTDVNTIESFDLERPEDNWFLSIVVNRMGDLIARLDIFSPFRYTISKLHWDVVFTDPILQLEIDREIAEKVTEVSYGVSEPIDWKKILERIHRERNGVHILLPQGQD